MSVTISLQGDLRLEQQLRLLALSDQQRQRALIRIGRKVSQRMRERIRNQKDIDNRPWKARKKGKQKMNRKLGRQKHLRLATSRNSVTVGYKHRRIGRIARAQQDGHDEIMTAAKMAQIHGEPDYDADATRQQARGLLDEGFTIRRARGKGRKRPTLSWIRRNLTLGQAGLILRQLRDEETLRQWVIPLPKRSFLGMNEQDRRDMVNTTVDEILNSIQGV